MKKIWHLGTCSTCKRIISDLKITEKDFEFYDLKNNPIKEEDLIKIKNDTGLNFEDLFSKRAMKFKKSDFSTENDYKEGILREYTFIKRPIIQIGKKYFIGNSKKTIEEAKNELS